MKLFLLLMFGLLCKGNLLERGYLPPPGSKIAGGSPGAIDVPLETPLESPNARESVSGHSNVGQENVNDGIINAELDRFPSSSTATQTSFEFTQTTTYSPLRDSDCTRSNCELIRTSQISTFDGSKSIPTLQSQFSFADIQQTASGQQAETTSPEPTSQISPLNIASSTQGLKFQLNGITNSTSVYQLFQNMFQPNKSSIQVINPQAPSSQNFIPRTKLNDIPALSHIFQQINDYNDANPTPQSSFQESVLQNNTSGNSSNNNTNSAQTQIRQPLPYNVVPQIAKNIFFKNPAIVAISNIPTEVAQIYPDKTIYSGSDQLSPLTGSFTASVNGAPQPAGTESLRPGIYHQPAQDASEINNESYRPQSDFERNATSLNYDNIITPEGYFSYSFDTSNGIHADESGNAIDGVKAEGSFSYIGDDGKLYSITYSADENGYQPKGDHLPTPPPIPEAIQRVIEQSTRDKAAGKLPDPGLYNESKYGYKKYQEEPSRRTTFQDQNDDSHVFIEQDGFGNKGLSTPNRLKYLPDVTSQSYEAMTYLTEKTPTADSASHMLYESKNQQFPSISVKYDGSASKLAELPTMFTRGFQQSNIKTGLYKENRPIDSQINKPIDNNRLPQLIVGSQNATEDLSSGKIISENIPSSYKVSNQQFENKQSQQTTTEYQIFSLNGSGFEDKQSKFDIFGNSQNENKDSSPKVKNPLTQESNNQITQKTSKVYQPIPQNQSIGDQYEVDQHRPGLSQLQTSQNKIPYFSPQVAGSSAGVDNNQHIITDNQLISEYEPEEPARQNAVENITPKFSGVGPTQNKNPYSLTQNNVFMTSHSSIPQNQEIALENQLHGFMSVVPNKEKGYDTTSTLEATQTPIVANIDGGYLIPVQIKKDDQRKPTYSSYIGINDVPSALIQSTTPETTKAFSISEETEKPSYDNGSDQNGYTKRVQPSQINDDARFNPSSIFSGPVSTSQSGNTDRSRYPTSTQIPFFGITETEVVSSGTPQRQQSNVTSNSSYQPSSGYQYHTPTNRFDAQKNNRKELESTPKPKGPLSDGTILPSIINTIGTTYPITVDGNGATIRLPIRKSGRPLPGSLNIFNVPGEISAANNDVPLSLMDSINPPDQLGYTSTNNRVSNGQTQKTVEAEYINSQSNKPTQSPLSTTNRGSIKYNMLTITTQRPSDLKINQKSLSQANTANLQPQTRGNVQFGFRNQPSLTSSDELSTMAPIQFKYPTTAPTRVQYNTSSPTRNQYSKHQYSQQGGNYLDHPNHDTGIQSIVTSTTKPIFIQNNQDHGSTSGYPRSMHGSGYRQGGTTQEKHSNPQNDNSGLSTTPGTVFNLNTFLTVRPNQNNRQHIQQQGVYTQSPGSDGTSSAQFFGNQHLNEPTNKPGTFGYNSSKSTLNREIQRQPSTAKPFLAQTHAPQHGTNTDLESPFSNQINTSKTGDSYFQSTIKDTRPKPSTFKPNQDLINQENTMAQGFIPFRNKEIAMTGTNIYSTPMPTGFTSRQLTAYQTEQGVEIRNGQKNEGSVRERDESQNPEVPQGLFGAMVPDSSRVKGETFSPSRQPPRYDPETGYHY